MPPLANVMFVGAAVMLHALPLPVVPYGPDQVEPVKPSVSVGFAPRIFSSVGAPELLAIGVEKVQS